MAHDPGAPDASLHALLFELTTLSRYPDVRKPRPRVTKAPYTRKPANPTNASQNTPSTELPDYGFGDLEKMATDIIGMKSLTTLAQIVQQQCRLMSDFKHKEECKDFLRKTCGKEAPRLHLDYGILDALGSPAVELALILYQYSTETDTFKSLLPPEGATVIASVATAGSGWKSEWETLLAVLGVNYDLHVVKTVLTQTHQTGRTGEDTQPGDESVTYDELAPRDTWPAVSESLYQQFCKESGKKRAAAIFHWGCISHHDTLTPEGAVVEDWARHEHWNMLDCIAMARHALDFLQDSGTLVLKVRIFKDGRTLHLVALLACAFEDCRIDENSRMPAEYATFVGLRFKGSEHKDVTAVRAILATCTTYREVPMTTHRLVHDPTYIQTLQRASDIRDKMELHHQHVTFIVQYVIFWIERACSAPPNRAFDYDELGLYLEALQRDAPAIIDTAWIPDVKQRIQQIIQDMQPQDLRELSGYIRKFKIQRFAKWPMRRALHYKEN